MTRRIRTRSLINLFGLYTLVVYGWILAEFFSQGAIVVPLSISALYLVALSFYVGDKEIRRFLKNHTHPLRHGEYYAYLWGITFVLAEIFILTGGDMLGYKVTNNMITNAGVVLLLFFISDYLKGNCERALRRQLRLEREARARREAHK